MTANPKKPQSERIRALLFDYGNTIAFLDYELLAREFSTSARKLDATALERAEYEGRATLDRILMGPNPPADHDQPYRDYFRAWLRAAGVEGEHVPECGRRFAALHVEASLWRVVRAGTLEALERLKSAGFKLAIVSNADGRVEGDARRLGMAPLFDAIIDSQVVGVAKPDPRIFQIALERLGVSPREARYAGDIYSIDMVGARAAGIAGKLIDAMGHYSWVEHERIRHVGELHPVG